MSVNVVDVKESNVEGFVAPMSVSILVVIFVVVTATLESVDLDAVIANDHGGVSGGQENDWKEWGGELHRGEQERSKEELMPQREKKSNLGDVYLRMRGWDHMEHLEVTGSQVQRVDLCAVTGRLGRKLKDLGSIDTL